MENRKKLVILPIKAVTAANTASITIYRTLSNPKERDYIQNNMKLRLEKISKRACLTLYLTGLVVPPGNGSLKVTIGGNHNQCNISLRSPSKSN